MNKVKDISGQTFTRLTAIRRIRPNKRNHAMWLCRCECGNEIIVNGSDLRSGHTRSCGCLQKEKTVKANTTHGQHNSRLYSIWHNICTRCHNPNSRDYKFYGGRGIKNKFACFEDFIHFASISGYRDNLTIDRINNDDDYCPENCQWATRGQQNRNKRDNVNITHPETGKTHCAVDWSRKLGGNDCLVRNRLKHGWSPDRAITTKPHPTVASDAIVSIP